MSTATPVIGPFKAEPELRRDLDIICDVLGMSMRQYILAAVEIQVAQDRQTFEAQYHTLRSLREELDRQKKGA